ncbi:hypothetical protein OF83DRAFT_1274537 [Amylostereum chailletii]|nr:hypothetical protein OF83DRAFT_1274537 [Amylostereum chailletii]
MYIKNLTIQGFKSYRDQTQIEPFLPRHNVVVGRNGWGMSSYFCRHPVRSLRCLYLHFEGGAPGPLTRRRLNSTTMAAYVEIIFDNTDNRFPTGREVKDEYSLDKKSASKADVMNLLESAGFSKSNPYYIVPQRLALLKEVAGTKSLRIMDKTEAKRNKIVELLEYIDTRLSELEEEKEELKEFQDKDKDRHCLDYALYPRELEDIGEALIEIEEERKNEVHGANQRRERFSGREQQIHTLEKKISETKHYLSTAAITRHGAQSEHTDLIHAQKELELRVEDLRAADARAGGKRAELESELEGIEAQIQAKEDELAQLRQQYDAKRNQEAELRRAHDEAKGRLSSLSTKHGRTNRFRTRAERDQYLRKEISSVQAHQQTQTRTLEAVRSELQAAEQSLAEVDTRMEGLRDRAEDGRARVKTLGEQIAQLGEEKAVLTEQRKELWREDAKVNSARRHAWDEFKSAKRALPGMMDKDTGIGLQAVDNIADRPGLDGVYGPLYRLFEITDPKFNIAVELTAGNSLFHVVVDTDQTASKVLDVMIKERTGKVTFMPFNRFKPKNPASPNAQDAITLLEKLSYQTTGRCTRRHSSNHGINTITLDGDKVDRKGMITGGYHDVRRSRIEAIKNVTAWDARFQAEDKRQREIKAATLKLDQKITQLSGRIQARAAKDSVGADTAGVIQEKERLEARVAKLQEDVIDLESELGGLSAKLEGYQDELSSPMAQGLSTEEEKLVDDLQRQIENQQKALLELSKANNELGSKKSIIKIELHEKLHRRRDELQEKIEALGEPEVSDATATDDLAIRQRELTALTQSIRPLNTQRDARDELSKVQNQQTEDISSMAKQQKNTERYMVKRNLLTGRKDECNRHIRDFGVLSEEAFEKYTNEKADRLVKKLHTIKEGLKKFRTETLDKSGESIEDLVNVLDQRKDEAIERTFKQVASNFEEVFERLVSAGKGKLIIQRRVDQVPFNSKVDKGFRIQQLSGGQKSLGPCRVIVYLSIHPSIHLSIYLLQADEY